MRKGLFLFVVLSVFMLNGCEKKKPPVDEFSSVNETMNITEGADMANANLTAESAPEALPDLTTTPAATKTAPTAPGTKPATPVTPAVTPTGVPETPKPVSKVSSKPTSEQIQTALKNAGYYYGPIDGKIGRTTEAAIETFQASNDLKPDGKVGPKTWEILSKYLKKSKKS